MLCQSDDFYREKKKKQKQKLKYCIIHQILNFKKKKIYKKKYFDFYYTGNLGKGQSN